MELRYPFVLLFGLVLIIAIFFFFKRKKQKYNSGPKVANTSYLKRNEYYKQTIQKYRLLTNVIKGLCLFSIALSCLLLSRVSKVDENEKNEYNRDIFLCMDVSDSVNELNLEIVKNMKETVSSLKGERFGISIFNTTNVILVPLTDDYTYVLDKLDELEENIYDRVNHLTSTNSNVDSFYYLVNSTTIGSNVRGSSLIGDGLASCIYSFPDLEKDPSRTRIVIFSTDNELAGKPYVTLEEAGKIGKKYKVTVYGVATEGILSKDAKEFKNAVEITGGEYYEESSSSVSSIVKNIESKSKSVLKGQTQTYKTDIPQLPFITLLISLVVLIILDCKVMS